MSLSEGSPSPFEDSPEGPEGPQGPEGAAEPEFNPFGLRNTEPNITPEEVGQELAIDVNWWDHVFCGFIKQSSGRGTEAWMHHVMAGILLVVWLKERQEGETVGESAPDEQPEPDEGYNPNQEVFNGPQ